MPGRLSLSTEIDNGILLGDSSAMFAMFDRWGRDLLAHSVQTSFVVAGKTWGSSTHECPRMGNGSAFDKPSRAGTDQSSRSKKADFSSD